MIEKKAVEVNLTEMLENKLLGGNQYLIANLVSTKNKNIDIQFY